MIIKGFDNAMQQLRNLQGSDTIVQKIIDETANKIVQDASANAPGSIGGHITATPGQLSNLISVGTSGGMDEYAAYQEFGVGAFAAQYVATLPKEWQEEAMRFFVTGKGHGNAHPFLFPAVARNSPDLMAAIEKELQKLAK